MSVPDSTSQHLEYLRDAYVYKVNAALEQGREDLAAELADDYLNEVRNALEVASHPRGEAASSPSRHGSFAPANGVGSATRSGGGPAGG